MPEHPFEQIEQTMPAAVAAARAVFEHANLEVDDVVVNVVVTGSGGELWAAGSPPKGESNVAATMMADSLRESSVEARP